MDKHGVHMHIEARTPGWLSNLSHKGSIHLATLCQFVYVVQLSEQNSHTTVRVSKQFLVISYSFFANQLDFVLEKL